jgi:hypothetical protein
MRVCEGCREAPTRGVHSNLCPRCGWLRKSARNKAWCAANRPPRHNTGKWHHARAATPELACTRCGVVQSSTRFTLGVRGRPGVLQPICLDCKGKEKQRESRRQLLDAPQRTCTKCSRTMDRAEFKPNGWWCAQCRAQYGKAWWRANPGKLREREQRRRARKLAVAKVDFTDEQWLEILEIHDNRCAYCLERCDRLERDHVVALSCGGDHSADNIVPACRRCNASKGARPVFMMAGHAA